MDSEIILVGNELLIGKIQDSNGQYIIHKLLEFGLKISRITIIADDVQIIANTINESLARRPMFLFLSGGLGPTYDDMTFEGIAKAFDVKLTLHPDAVEFIKDRYLKLFQMKKTDSYVMNESRSKMAMLPENAKALRNPDGAAPAAYIEIKEKKDQSKIVTRLISMPGVPAELTSIFEMHVIPMLQNLHCHYYNTGFMFEGVGESTIASELKNLRTEYPDIWIKTHPQKTRTLPIRVELHLTAFLENDNPEENERLKARIEDLKEKIRRIIEQHDGVIQNS